MPTSRALDALFFTAFALLLCHELDAVLHAEWRLLPLLSLLSDAAAYPIFVLLHAPIIVVLLMGLTSASGGMRWCTQIGVDVFLVAHAGLHAAFLGHAAYSFHGPLSHGLIMGAALVGLLHGALLLRQRAQASSLR